MTMQEVEPLKGVDPRRAPRNPGPEHDDCDLTWDGKPRCIAHSTTANPRRRCGRAQTPGTTVCASHGSKAPQVRAKAALRLATLVDPAIAVFSDTMKATDASNSDKLRAAENVMDRAGFPRRTEVDDGTARALLTARLLALREQAIEGEVVSDDGE